MMVMMMVVLFPTCKHIDDSDGGDGYIDGMHGGGDAVIQSAPRMMIHDDDMMMVMIAEW